MVVAHIALASPRTGRRIDLTISESPLDGVEFTIRTDGFDRPVIRRHLTRDEAIAAYSRELLRRLHFGYAAA